MARAGTDVRGHVPAIELIAINKSFGEVHANKDVNLTVERGTIGIVGENGAGKSTLMSILYGFYEADSGEIHVNGKPVSIRSPAMPSMSASAWCTSTSCWSSPDVVENVMLGAEGGAMLRAGEAKVRAELARLARRLRPRDRCRRHRRRSVGRPAAARRNSQGALSRRATFSSSTSRPRCSRRRGGVPCSGCSVAEGPGKTVILITHKLREIMAVTDRVSVMRRGEMVATVETANTSPPELAELMVGRRVLLRVEKAEQSRRSLLEVENLSVVDPAACCASRTPPSRFTPARSSASQAWPATARANSWRPSPACASRSRNHAASGARHRFTDHNPHRMRQLGLLHVPEDRLRMGLVPAFPAFECHPRLQRRPQLGSGPILDHDRMIADLARRWSSTTCARPRRG